MTASAAQRQDYPAAGLVGMLVSRGSDLGRQLAAAMPLPLRDYLRSVAGPGGGPVSKRWLAVLAEALARALAGQRRPDADDVCARFGEQPVLQQADHSNLLLDSETFLNNYLFQVAVRQAGSPYFVTSQCSTVVCFSRRVPPCGPVFLHTRGAVLNVFGLSKTTYKASSFCALPGPLTLRFDVLDGAGPAGDPVLTALAGRTFGNAADAYRECNDEIWRMLPVPGDPIRIAVDERMTSEAIALHLRDESSPLHRLIFDAGLRDEFLRVKREIVNSGRNIVINRAEPDWFWCRRGSRLHPVVLSGGGLAAAFTVESDGAPLPVPAAPAPLALALRAGDIYGDKIASYLVRCLLPGAVAVGGTVQQDYVDCYRLMMLETDRRHPFLSLGERAVIARDDLSRLGGAPLIELDQAGQRLLSGLGPDTDLAHWLDAWLDLPVGVTIGRLDCAWFYEQNLRRADERGNRQRGEEGTR